MGLLLGIIAEARSHYNKEKHSWINYCNMNQYVYFDIGYETGVPIGRIVIKVNEKYSKSVTEVFIRLARGDFYHPGYGKLLKYEKTSLHCVSKSKNLVMGGDCLYENGSLGSAPVKSGIWQESEITSNVDETRGKVVFLSADYDPNIFTSIFYILLEKSGGESSVDGCVVGEVIQGIDILDEIVDQYGTNHGKPTKNLILHNCGHL